MRTYIQSDRLDVRMLSFIDFNFSWCAVRVPMKMTTSKQLERVKVVDFSASVL